MEIISVAGKQTVYTKAPKPTTKTTATKATHISKYLSADQKLFGVIEHDMGHEMCPVAGSWEAGSWSQV